MKKLFLAFLFSSILFTSKLYAIDTKAEQAIVMDFDTNEILFEKNSNIKTPPASMTKIMTVYAAFDRLKNTDLSIENECVVSAKAYKMGGSRTFLEIDDKVSIDELLKGIIIQSGNDASVALAECLAGTEDDFAKLMNVYAKRIGMRNTNFLNSSGWPEDNHYSTVYDLALLSNSLINEFPDLYLYFSDKEFTYNDIKQPNRNKLLSSVQGADGLKTGFTRASGWGIAATAKRDDRRITAVINGTNSSRSRLNEASNLINWAFSQTSQKLLVDENQVIVEVDVWLGNKPRVNLVSSKKIVSTLSFDQIQLIKSSLEYKRPIEAPIKKGEVYGKLLIDIDGKPNIEVELIAQENVGTVNPISKVFAAMKYLIFGTSLDE
jgi:D-alanyl-D-alanine carboxypeptidase (penicillin-binding protein 5/6)|tara:strand:- start:397 stop:1530 length:1134 start_codon:yes stop_codon:yes gene_type:complete